MGEKRFELSPYGVRYICSCGGDMVGGEIIVDGHNPPSWLHRCVKCDSRIVLDVKYPTVRWEEVK